MNMIEYCEIDPSTRRRLIDNERPDIDGFDRKVTAALVVQEFVRLSPIDTVTPEQFRKVRAATGYILDHHAAEIPGFFSGITAEDLRLV